MFKLPNDYNLYCVQQRTGKNITKRKYAPRLTETEFSIFKILRISKHPQNINKNKENNLMKVMALA